MRTWLLRFGFFSFLLFSLVSCDLFSQFFQTKVSGVKITPTSWGPSIPTLGTVQQFSATVSPTNATNTAVKWSTSNAGVVTINTSGVATTTGYGTATIAVTTDDGGYTATASVNTGSGP